MSSLVSRLWHRRPLWWVLNAGMLLAIALASLLSPGNLPVSTGGHDKLWHATAYFVAALLWRPLLRRPSSLVLVWIGLVAYGALMEVLQGIGGVRSFEWLDMLANGSGVTAATLLLALLWRRVLPPR
ncbi:MAG: hypothetical protein J0L65_12250 [Xanthomonadales bacterium]|nr:hypothetical protein [Xanthomonadales bacterium]